MLRIALVLNLVFVLSAGPALCRCSSPANADSLAVKTAARHCCPSKHHPLSKNQGLPCERDCSYQEVRAAAWTISERQVTDAALKVVASPWSSLATFDDSTDRTNISSEEMATPRHLGFTSLDNAGMLRALHILLC
jgi:hypothetical protein